jgi:hypothetical protein
MKTPDREEVIKYFTDAKNHFVVYYNHKGNMVWGADAFYCIIIMQVLIYYKQLTDHNSRSVVLIVVLFIAWLVYKFLERQLELVRFASSLVSALYVLISECLISSDLNIATEKLKTRQIPKSGFEPGHKQSDYYLALIVLEKRQQFEEKGAETSTVPIHMIA